jgi:hypothetical protein
MGVGAPGMCVFPFEYPKGEECDPREALTNCQKMNPSSSWYYV